MDAGPAAAAANSADRHWRRTAAKAAAARDEPRGRALPPARRIQLHHPPPAHFRGVWQRLAAGAGAPGRIGRGALERLHWLCRRGRRGLFCRVERAVQHFLFAADIHHRHIQAE